MSSNNPGKNKPNQNRVDIPVGTGRPRRTPPEGGDVTKDSAATNPPQPTTPPQQSASVYDPNAPLPRPRRLDRTERIRDVAQGNANPQRRSSSGARAGATSKRAVGVATPSAASRAAVARAARARTNRQIKIVLVVLAILLIGSVLLIGILGNNNNTTNSTVASPAQTATAGAAAAVVSNTTPLTPTASAPLTPTLPYPGGVPPTAAAILTPAAAPKPGPIAINVSKGVADKTMTIYTSRGTIVAGLFTSAAPNTVENYETRANRGEYNGRKWHRAENWVLQGNDPTGTGSGGGNIPTEINKVPFGPGSLGIARTNDITYSNDSQFFIDKSTDPNGGQDFSFLNGVFSNTTPTGGYTNWGQVVSGMDVVDAMQVGDIIYTIKITDTPPSATSATPPAPAAPITGTNTITSTGGVTNTGTVTNTGGITNTGGVTNTTPPTSTATVAPSAPLTGTATVAPPAPLTSTATLAPATTITATGTLTK
jgi:cyclophilin family peptidyl-prolyl cis-trans isomerase